jgi:hypothetical protein
LRARPPRFKPLYVRERSHFKRATIPDKRHASGQFGPWEFFLRKSRFTIRCYSLFGQ